MECRRKSSTEEELDDGKCKVPLRAFSSNELLKATNNFHRRNIITEDGCYRLYKGCLEKCPILVKKFGRVDGVWAPEDFKLLATNDMVITSKVCINHRNILKLIGCCLEFKFPVLVYECETSSIQTLSNGLDRRVRSSDNSAFETRLSIANDIAGVLVHLHTAFSTPIVHRNLKPGNFIIDHRNGVAKLIDFSFAIQIPPGESQVEDRVVIRKCGFVEPEYEDTGIVSEKSDVYAFGMIMLELLTGKRTGDGGTRLDDLVKRYAKKNQLMKVVDPRMIRDGILGVDHKQSHDFLKLALRCVEEKREDRPEMIGVAVELSGICSPGGCGGFRIRENKKTSIFTPLFRWLKR